MQIVKSKIFDTRTAKGLRAAERYQQHLYNLYSSVRVTPAGLDKVKVEGSNEN